MMYRATSTMSMVLLLLVRTAQSSTLSQHWWTQEAFHMANSSSICSVRPTPKVKNTSMVWLSQRFHLSSLEVCVPILPTWPEFTAEVARALLGRHRPYALLITRAHDFVLAWHLLPFSKQLVRIGCKVGDTRNDELLL